MVATVDIMEVNTVSETETSKSSGTVRFKAADNATVDTSNPLPIPTSDRTYSYEKWLAFKITGGTFTNITNVRFYMDGSLGYVTGVKLWYATDATFSTPVAPSNSNDPPQHDATGMTQVASTPSSGTPLTIGSGTYTTTGLKGDYLVLVMEVETTATASGSTGSETMTWAYDEV